MDETAAETDDEDSISGCSDYHLRSSGADRRQWQHVPVSIFTFSHPSQLL